MRDLQHPELLTVQDKYQHTLAKAESAIFTISAEIEHHVRTSSYIISVSRNTVTTPAYVRDRCVGFALDIGDFLEAPTDEVARTAFVAQKAMDSPQLKAFVSGLDEIAACDFACGVRKAAEVIAVDSFFRLQ